MAKLHRVSPRLEEIPFLGLEPTWNGVGDTTEEKNSRVVTSENYKIELIRGLNWHNDIATRADLHQYIEEWIREYRPAATVEADLKAWKKVSKTSPFGGTCPKIARMQLQGFDLSVEDIARIWTFVEETEAAYTKETVVNEDGGRPSVQDYINDQIADVTQQIQSAIDILLDGGQVTFPEVLSDKFKATHYNRIQKYILERQEQLELVRPSSKRIKEVVGILTVAAEEVGVLAKKLKKEQKRAYKPVDPKKTVKKLKYLKEFEGVKSIAPVDMLGANIVWVYDTSKRKIGYYKAEMEGSITVKGTTVLGIKDSVQKILRKPEEQLVEFKALRKNQVKAWFDGIKAVEQELNGRTNDNLLLLRAD